MAKIGSLTSVVSGYLGTTAINANFSAIETAFANTVSRDGSSPNTMTADLDMNSNQLLNLATPTSNTHAATKLYVDNNTGAASVAAAAASASAAASSATSASTSATAAASSASSASSSATAAAASAVDAANSAALAAFGDFDDLTETVAATGDYLLFSDVDDSGNNKKDTISDILGLVSVAAGNIQSNAVTTAKIADSNVTKAKIENLTDYTVLGNVSGGAAAPAEVTILDEDDLNSDSATALATQQSIKAYIDNNSSTGALLGVQAFTSSGTYTPTAGTNQVLVIVTGGGGGGSGNGGAGGTGGTSSFGSFCTATGGSGGAAVSSGSDQNGADGGAGSGGTLNLPGGPGGTGFSIGSGSTRAVGGQGGASYWGGGGRQDLNGSGSANATVYGAGGGGTTITSDPSATGAGGGAGGTAIEWITSGLGATETVTVGAAGTAGSGAGAGAAGVVLVYEYS